MPRFSTTSFLFLFVFLYGLELTNAGIIVGNVTPACGPAGGKTVVEVTGTGFVGPMSCLFGDLRVEAVVASEETLTCTTNPTNPGKVPFSLKLSNETVHTNFSYEYYTDPTIFDYKPRKGPLNKQVPVAVHGSFESTGTYTCLFNNSEDRSVVTSGNLSDDKGVITCYTPKWPQQEQVSLSVSLNGQQYSISVPFMFKKETFNVSSTVWILLGAALLVVVVLSALVVVWVRHRHYITGYNKIKEGNAEVDLSEIKYGNVIGRGTFGEVYKGTWRGAVVAVKKLNSSQMSEEFVREYEREVYLMRTLRAPNILQFLGSTFNPPDICIVMEYMSRGSLYNILHDESCTLEWPLILHMLADTAKGMTYLHTCKPPVIHRDLKSHNLLVDEFWRVKVSDFGLSTVFEQTDQTMAAYGTPCWTAPEVLRNLHYTVKADVYSFGIVMWECVTRADPYGNMLPYKVIYAVGNKGLRPPVPEWVPRQYASLMESCWDDDMDMRPEFPAILDGIEEMAQLKWTGQPGPDNNASSGGNNNTNRNEDEKEEQETQTKKNEQQTNANEHKADEKLPLLSEQDKESYTINMNNNNTNYSNDSSERSTSFHTSSDEDQ